MKSAIATLFAAASLVVVAGCDTRAEQGNASLVRYQVDPTQDRSWWITRDGVVLNSATHAKRLVALPGWLWAMEPLCPPDIAVGADGEAVVTSNVVPTLWRIEPRTLAVTVHEVQLDSDNDKDVGFTAITYSPEQDAYFAYSESPRAVWKIDRQLSHATKVASMDLSRVRSPRTGVVRGPCGEINARLARFAGMAG